MSIDFPTNTVVLIIAAMIGAGAGSWFILSQGLERLPIASHVKRVWRWGAAIVLLAWLLARLLLAMNPSVTTVLATPYTFISLIFLVLGLLAGILLLLSPFFRQIIRAAPATWLVGIHAIRFAGFNFLALMDMNLLPAGFALPAGYGDMLVALLALGVVYLLAKRKPYARALAIGWNGLGLLDFAVALTTAFIYNGPFVDQLAASGVSLLYLNYVFLIPSFAVPLFGLLHIYSLFQMLSAQADRTKQDARELGEARADSRRILSSPRE